MNRETAQWVLKAEEDWNGARNLADQEPPLRDLATFHCQQSAEKYLKALLQENGCRVPRTHNLDELLDLLLLNGITVRVSRRSLQSLSQYAVGFRYPGRRATTRQMNAAFGHAERVRNEIRNLLGLPP